MAEEENKEKKRGVLERGAPALVKTINFREQDEIGGKEEARKSLNKSMDEFLKTRQVRKDKKIYSDTVELIALQSAENIEKKGMGNE